MFSALSPDPGGADPDAKAGRLTAAKLYHMKIAASLIVLSACDTGRGKISQDGVMSLARPFLSAGGSSVVASLWDIPDSSTAMLMSQFYRELPRTENRASALRASQLKLLHSLQAGTIRQQTPAGELTLPADPHLWAGIILTGRP